MNIRWLWFDYVPPELGLSREERRAVETRTRELWRKGREREVRRKANRLIMLAWLPAIAAMGAGLLMGLRLRITGMPPWGMSRAQTLGSGVILFSIWACGSVLAGSLAHRKTCLPFLRQALRELGHDVCPDCGYLLRGLGKDITRCPECGWLREEMPPEWITDPDWKPQRNREKRG